MPRALSHVYYDPITPENNREMEKIFKSLTSQDPSDPPIPNRKLSTWGRQLNIPESTSKIAKFKFEQLCGQPLSAADYLEVTKNFGTIFLLDIPKMRMDQKDLVSGNVAMQGTQGPDSDEPQARRFITFIDGSCFYSFPERLTDYGVSLL